MNMPIDDHFIPSADGLQLHVRSYGVPSSRLPVVCLPGLARTADDFDTLARALAADAQTPRRVLALSYRGRGRSDYDPKPENYNVPVETGDVIHVLQSLKADPAIFVGTSRGGIIAMLMAQIRPATVAGVVLNDIGPVLERVGLARIKGYIGKMRTPTDIDDGARVLRELFGSQFPKLTTEQWTAAARRAFKQDGGRLVPTYDIALAKGLEAWSPEMPIPDMWPQFASLADKPVMVIRGENTDLLSMTTVAEMKSRHPALETISVPDQGHPPLLVEDDIIARIAAFLRSCDARQAPSQS
jgi:pimeloyl-ACP methyl ester carboxylesterase